ncbi:fluoride efflux transporter CrcB [Candidatus Poribacteria bacterium]|nr:fluoride efflux transporter CrcB [Candidatus Poribacteria bacterium]
MLQKLLWLTLAGALGTLARYGIAGTVQRGLGGEFPWGTLAVNLAGCFLAGIFLSLAEGRLIGGEARTIIFIGFMGAFTTFSAFVLETSELLQDTQWAWAMGNIMLQNACGIVIFFVGLILGRLV